MQNLTTNVLFEINSVLEIKNGQLLLWKHEEINIRKKSLKN